MTQAQSTDELTGKLLIAMPGMGDPRFEHSVVYVCEHDRQASMGLIVNKPLRDLQFAPLLKQLGIETGPRTRAMPVHFGGPVETARGFVLHSTDYASAEGTQRVGDRFALTASRDVLDDLAGGRGPEKAILALGYAGWGAGQLTREIGANGWLTCEADPRVVFGRPDDQKWAAALALMGVDPQSLSAAAGRA